MKIARFNWPLWLGFLLSVLTLLSYPLLFVRWPVTRDFPWANLLLLAITLALLFLGWRRAFGPEKEKRSRVVASVVSLLGVAVLGLFLFSAFVMARWLPAAAGAPRIGEKAPEFNLADASGKSVSLSQLLTTQINSSNGPINPKGVLLIFYRGYW